jgi:hypothetical protein
LNSLLSSYQSTAIPNEVRPDIYEIVRLSDSNYFKKMDCYASDPTYSYTYINQTIGITTSSSSLGFNITIPSTANPSQCYKYSYSNISSSSSGERPDIHLFEVTQAGTALLPLPERSAVHQIFYFMNCHMVLAR